MGSLSRLHFVIFPFMAQGHTIPLLHLARLLRRRLSTPVTIFTTPANAAFIRTSLPDSDVSLLQLPFPQNIPGVPPGVENTNDLPSMESFLPFVKSTKLMRENFEIALQNLSPPVSCVISDGFLGWTVESTKKFRVPRLVFFGMGNYSCTMYQVLGMEKPHRYTNSMDELFFMPGFEDLKLTRNDFNPPFNEIEPSGEYLEFIMEQIAAMTISYGVIVNSFYEFEKCFADFWNKKIGPKAVCVGPLCLAAPMKAEVVQLPTPPYIKFLDEKLRKGESVLYVAFGTQADVSGEQLEEIAKGLEKSKVNFLWVLKANRSKILKGFMEKTKNRGLVVEDWVDQLKILNHGSVGGFLSHCGWNSVMESVTAGVPMVALPLMAEQHLNARFVAEEAGVGVRVMAANGSVRGFVAAEEVERMVKEVMGSGKKGAAVRQRVDECGVAARLAMEDGGSSICALDELIEEVSSYPSILGVPKP